MFASGSNSRLISAVGAPVVISEQLSQQVDRIKQTLEHTLDFRTPESKWMEEEKDVASEIIRTAIDEEEAKLSETIKLIRHTQAFISNRIQTRHKVGLIVSMKQLIKHEAHKERSETVITRLQLLYVKAQKSRVPVPYQAEMDEILATEAKICCLEDEGDILKAAKQRVNTLDRAASTQGRQSRAA